MDSNQIGNFKILQKLGEGGMGVVYKGIDVQLERPVAIKMLNPDLARNPELVQRFQAEARAQANLNHANVATLYAFLVTEQGACMVMEFVEGDSFEELIRRGGPMNPRDAVPLFKQALLGIGAAHRMGIVHRDIKPANLMVNRQGMVKVMDFGIAKALGTRGMTRTGMQMGTIFYMSPEQIQGRGVDVRTDIYALGVTLYEMLSGHVPFEGDSDFQIMNDHISTPPPSITRYHPYAPKEFDNVIAKALEKNPDNRFQTVEEFGAALEHPENVPAPTHASPVPPPARRPGTIIEQPLGSSVTAAFGASPAPAPGFIPAPVTTAPATIPSQAPVPPPAGSNRNKVIAGIVVVAALVLLGIVLKPKRPEPVVGGGVGGASAVTSNRPTGPVQPRNDTPNILVASGGGTSPASNSTVTPDVTGGNRTPRQKAATPVRQTQGPSVQAQAQQPQQTQPQAPQPTPQTQPQQQPSQGRSFPVKHRHVVMRGFQSFTYFCGGWLTVHADGSVTYFCSATNDPSGRCERVTFPPGSIKNTKLSGGELHITTSTMGNWDFFDLNVAGSTAGAYQAIMAGR
jgi:serine/threonine protein kinase